MMDVSKLCINGDREIVDYQILLNAIDWFKIDPSKVKVVLSGGAKGADKLGERWAKENNIPIKVYDAKWNDLSQPDAKIKTNAYGKQYDAMAGFRRNGDMAQDGTSILSLQTNGTTSGSNDCVEKFEKIEKSIMVFGKAEQKNYLKKDSSVESDEIPF